MASRFALLLTIINPYKYALLLLGRTAGSSWASIRPLHPHCSFPFLPSRLLWLRQRQTSLGFRSLSLDNVSLSHSLSLLISLCPHARPLSLSFSLPLSRSLSVSLSVPCTHLSLSISISLSLTVTGVLPQGPREGRVPPRLRELAGEA